MVQIATAIALTDIERAIADRDPQLGDLLIRYLTQADPDPGKPEVPTAEDLAREDSYDDDPPEGAMTLRKLRQELAEPAMRGKTATEKKLARREAWERAHASPYAPPRLKLGTVLVELYQRGDVVGRDALIRVFKEGRLGWGVWRAIKTIYKLAEANHDATMLGVIGYRFDVLGTSALQRGEIGAGTMIYIRRRAWRWLRQLGHAVPDAFPTFAVEVLRHYPPSIGQYTTSWVAANIWAHKQLKGQRLAMFKPPNDLDARAFPDAWKLSPAPLLRLLDQADNDLVLQFAIRCLRADHPLALRAVEPAWLSRIGRRPHGALHSFVVSLFKDSAELHQSRLRALGLHDVVLGWLRSPAADARAYALEYATAHAPDIPVPELVALVSNTSTASEVVKFASARLEAAPAEQLGVEVMARLLRVDATRAWATKRFQQAFRPSQLDLESFLVVAIAGDPPRQALATIYGQASAIPAAYLTALVRDKRADYRATQFALAELGKRSGADVGVAWFQAALEDKKLTDTVSRWLAGEMFAGDQLDVGWVKGLIAKPRLRPHALRILGDRRLITPSRIGLDWLLDQARSADTELHTFAHRLLLEHFAPEDFAEAGASGARAAGLDRLWDLAAGKGRPEPVRAFAQTYLRAHHPVIGKQLAEARQLGLEPRLSHVDYPLARVEPLVLDDDRADVRRFAAAITSEEIVRWGDPSVLYELAGSRHREPRTLGCELLLSLGAPADPAAGAERIPATWLDGRRLFALAESTHKAAREAALTLIRRAYDRVGGADRLAWLMESPERDVRLFAVRLFWDRHRPAPVPPTWTPRKDVGAPTGGERFADADALRAFLRRTLFGLPPGRLEKRDPLPGGAMPERPLAASVAKRRLIEAVRALAIDDLEFARVVVPVLTEMAASVAKGEWQTCVAALAAIRRAQPEIGSAGLPPPRVVPGALTATTVSRPRAN